MKAFFAIRHLASALYVSKSNLTAFFLVVRSYLTRGVLQRGNRTPQALSFLKSIPLCGFLLVWLLLVQTSLAGNEVQLVRETPRSFLIKTGDYTITYDPESRDDGKGWVLIRREGKEHGLATKLAIGHHLNVTDLGGGEQKIYRWKEARKDAKILRSLNCKETDDKIVVRFNSERRWARFQSALTVYKQHPGLIHWRVDAKALADQSFSNAPKPDCYFTHGEVVYDRDVFPRPVITYHAQRGPTAGALYFRDTMMDSFVFYFEDLSSMNKLYELTGSAVPYDYDTTGNGGAVKMGQAKNKLQFVKSGPPKPYQDVIERHASFGYERPQNFRVPKGTDLTLADTYLYLKPVEKTDNISVSRHYVESLATVYQYIYKPPVIATDWVGEVMPQLFDDVMRPENLNHVRGKYYIPKAYVQYRPQDNQLWTLAQILHPLEVFVKQHPDDSKARQLREMLNTALPTFYNREHGWIHNNSGDTYTNSYYHTVYIFNPINMVMDLALLGNENAKEMVAGCRTNLLKMGENLNYVFGDIHIKNFDKINGGYQFDASGMYADLMMGYYELSGRKDEAALNAARKAVETFEQRCFDFSWQINMTVGSALACAKLYRATGEQKYLDLSYIALASSLGEAWLWECDFGVGKYTTTFWGMSGCPAAPSNAEYETSRARLAYKQYETLIGDELRPDVRALIHDAWKRGPTQSRFALPPFVKAAGGARFMAREGTNETNCGKIDYQQMIPLEDISPGWGTDLEWFQNNSKLGVVGQEIYGAGGPIWYAVWQSEAGK